MQKTWPPIAFLLSLLLAAPNLYADANDGDLFGYDLGATYDEPDNKPLDDGRLVLLATRSPVKPSTIETVYVLATPVSRTIGKIAGETWFADGEDALVAYERFRAILREKYGDWESQERSDVHFQGSSMTSEEYSLGIQVSGPHRDNPPNSNGRPFQMVISLGYRPSTAAAADFEQLADQEVQQAAAGKFSEDDQRGL